MKRKGIGVYLIIILVFGLAGLARSSENVRAVQVVGLFGSGMATGAGLFGLITALRSKD